MQWEFRKALQSFEGYKRTTTYKNEIQNGDQNTLDMVVRQAQLILSDKNQKIISKVLALRFIRDIMVLGQEDIVRKVEKLIPQFTKVCSHDLNSADPDRGETYFHDHPAYVKLTDAEEKKQVDTFGSTYFILSLQSILHWAKWIPTDSNGQQSIYVKAYKSLIDRGVTFPATFHYYKQSDTEKFKNMFKMEFFTDSYQSAYSETPSSVQQPSQLSEIQQKPSKSGWQKKSRAKEQNKPSLGSNASAVDEYTGQTRNLKTVPEMMQYLNELKASKLRKMSSIRQLNKKIQDMYEVQVAMGKLPKQQKRWIENYIINFSLLNNNIIDYDQFLQRSLSEQVILESGVQQADITINRDYRATPMKPSSAKPGKQMSKVQKNQYTISKVGDQDFVKREYQYKSKINSVLLQLQGKNNEIAVMKSNYQKQKARLIDQYENRIVGIKMEVKKGQQDKGVFQKQLEKQNQKLRARVTAMQQELGSLNGSSTRQRQIQAERNQLLTRVKRLEIQNQKLTHIKSSSKAVQKEISTLEAQLKEKETAIQKIKSELKKSQKIIQNYQDEAGLYKSELINQRAKHDQKVSGLSKTSESLMEQNKSLKQKALQLRKTLDIKQIQILNIRQELKRYQSKVRDLNDKKGTNQIDYNRSDQWLKSKTALMYQSPNKLQLQSPPTQQAESYNGNVYNSEKKLRFNNYQDFFLELKPKNKELFIRLCRCALKKKDILFKQNQLQIGIISEVIAQNKLKFILHFTNTSQRQIQNLKVQYNISQSYISTLDYSIDNKYVFCIQPQEQQKISVIVTNQQTPYLKQRAILQITFEKNGSFYSNNVFLPLLIPKFFDFYKPKQSKSTDKSKNLREALQFRYNKKMLPKPSSLKGYFQQIQQLSQDKFQVEAYHRQTDVSIKINFNIASDTETMVLEALVLKEKINERQKYVFEELVSFLQIAFKR